MTTQDPSLNNASDRIKEVMWVFRMLKKNISGRKKRGYKILRMKDVEKEWDFIIDCVDKYLAEKDMEVDYSLSYEENFKKWVKKYSHKVVVHFYHHPRDTEEPFVIGNKKLIERGFRILWVFNPDETSNKFISNLTDCMGVDTLKHCKFLHMDNDLKIIPINFTVIAPHHKGLPLVYVRFEDLDLAIRIDSHGQTPLLFDDLGYLCIQKVIDQYNKKDGWINPLLED